MSELSEEQKLVQLGLKQPTRQSSDGGNVIESLKGTFGEEWPDFQDAYIDDDPQDFDAVEQFLVDNGMADDGASSIRTDFENRYADFGEFDTAVRDISSYERFEKEFGTSNEFRSDVEGEDGQPAAGFKVYESGGVGRDGQYIPQGGVEMWGQEVHFSQTGVSEDDEEPGDSDGGTTYKFGYSNLEISNTNPYPNETITVSCSLTNPSSNERSESVQLYLDGETEESEHVNLGAGNGTTVEFEISFDGFKQTEVGIGPLSPETVSVIHPNIR